MKQWQQRSIDDLIERLGRGGDYDDGIEGFWNFKELAPWKDEKGTIRVFEMWTEISQFDRQDEGTVIGQRWRIALEEL